MAVYRFRVFIEDDHEVYRDIELQGRQRFADFHRAIVKAFNFQPDQPATYYSSDQSWYEGDVVVDLDEHLEGDHQKISAHIFDPHQRFLCVTSSYNDIGLAIELQRIVSEKEDASYPLIARSAGDPPYYTQPPPEPIKEEEPTPSAEEELINLLDEDGPSEEEIERIQREAEEAGSKGDMKAPDIDMGKLKIPKVGKPEAEADDDSDDDESDDKNFSDFDMDDLM